MSITSLADEEVARTEPDFVSARMRPVVAAHVQGLTARYAQTDTPLPAGLSEDVLPLATLAPTPKTSASTALNSLARYIPTEAVTLYVAAVGTLLGFTGSHLITPVVLYWCFAGVTPALFLLIFMGKRRGSGLSVLPKSPCQWPWWKLSACTIAFLVWALAVPGAPYISGPQGKVAVGFGAVFVSTILTLVEAILEPKGSSPSP